MGTADQVPEPLLTQVVSVFGPRRIILFGSRARGDARTDSDFDLVVAGSVFYPVATPTFLSVTNRGGNLQLSWPTNGSLLQTTNLTGPWTTNSAALSPFTVSPTNAQMFYRSLTP